VKRTWSGGTLVGTLAKAAGLVSAALAVFGCGASPEQPHLEVPTRNQVPIAVCTSPLGAPKRAGSRSIVRNLDPEEWARILMPSFSEEKGLIATETDCTGNYVFANETLRGGVSAKGWPRILDPEEIDTRAGPEGMRVVWLRVLKFENGDDGGPIALVRAVDDHAEIYGIGSFRGPAKSKIEPVRMGNENLVVAESKVCPDPDDCRKRAQFYLVRRGRLIEAASVDLERTSVVPSVLERGLYARYQLVTDVQYKPNGIQLLEQVSVKIIHYEEPTRDSDRELRKVEFSRFLRVERDTLFSSNDPLWERVVGQD
jgi:hypothetical protein